MSRRQCRDQRQCHCGAETRRSDCLAPDALATLTLQLDGAVTVAGGTPTLALNNDGMGVVYVWFWHRRAEL
jgi:hypothetical protein